LESRRAGRMLICGVPNGPRRRGRGCAVRVLGAVDASIAAAFLFGTFMPSCGT